MTKRRRRGLLDSAAWRALVFETDYARARMADLLKLLGRPDGRDRECAWYMPNQGTALFLEAGEDGLLRATKFT